jgi:CheY-like chemotaxis protein
MMDGEIGLDSTPGAGSTFWFSVPAPAVGGTLTAPATPVRAQVQTGPLRILVVDDVPMNRELVATMLSPFDVQLVEAANGAEAVEAAARTPFEVILMDLQMPVMDGLAATAEIRARSPLNRLTPILALTANVLPAHIEACRRAGMDDHLGKPIDPEVLISKIAHWTAPDAA